MEPAKKELVSIAILLREPRALDLPAAQRATEFAFRGAPELPKVTPIQNKPAYAVLLGPMRLAILNINQPYFRDAVKAAESAIDYPARQAILQHTAWLSVDLVGEPPPISRERVYAVMGRLVAELLGDDVLGVMRLPEGPLVGYDFSFIPLFRSSRASDVFGRGTPDRIVKVKDMDAELAAATAEAMRRWPDFRAAFANRRKDQHFFVKKRFVEGDKNEHMWVVVTNIVGGTISGLLSNEPNTIKSIKCRDPVTLLGDEVEDWSYTDGKENFGGFQAKVIRKNQ